MTTSLLRVLQPKLRRRNHSQKGFTLIELLIVTLIAGGIVSGLMFLVVELLTADQRDASRNATQQDMQRSMEYMSTELREAVYVYSGSQLHRIIKDNYLPTSLSQTVSSTEKSTPVIAFWKQAPLPSNALAYCSNRWQTQDDRGNPPIQDTARNSIPCASGSAYSLVVYSLNTIEDGPWLGRARVTRYELRPYNNNPGQPVPVTGYVSPIAGARNLFANWPLAAGGTPTSPPINRQIAAGGRPTGAAVPLTDFVDAPQDEDEPQDYDPRCPRDSSGNEYKISPSNETGEVLGLDDFPYSFYACIYTGANSPTPSPSPTATPTPSPSPDDETASISNQEVVLYLRGNGEGRPSITATGNNAYRPTLTTRVFNRGTLDINPND